MEEVKESFQKSAEQAQSVVQKSIEQVQSTVADTAKDFGSRGAVMGSDLSSSVAVSSEFFDSNSIIAKAAFFLLVLVVFVILLNLGINILGYFMRPSSTPYIVYGTLQCSESHVVSQDPKQAGSVSITRSNNQTTGMEFTWSTWLLITDNTASKYQHIFNKGNAPTSNAGRSLMKKTGSVPASGIASINNGPGLYLAPLEHNENTLLVVMDTIDMSSNTIHPTNYIEVKEIPFNKWCNVVIRLENTLLDVYVNGTITQRLTINSVAKQNFDDIQICQNGGFPGQLSNLKYYNYALSAFEINAVVIGGPNTSMSTLSSSYNNNSKSNSYYLSNLWYTSKY